MKFNLLGFLLVISSISIFSCSKSSTPSIAITGTWKGTLTGVNEASSGNLYYSFIINADSSIVTQSTGSDGKTYYGAGTWKLSGQNFSAKSNSNGTAQTISATFSSTKGTLSSGVWSNDNGTDSGTFSMTKSN
jgi:hypothetical protein